VDSLKDKPVRPDVLVHNEGTVFLFNPLTDRSMSKSPSRASFGVPRCWRPRRLRSGSNEPIEE